MTTTDPHHPAYNLTKPQRRMLANLLLAEREARPPVYPWGHDWKPIERLMALSLVTIDMHTGPPRADLTDRGREWATLIVNLGRHL